MLDLVEGGWLQRVILLTACIILNISIAAEASLNTSKDSTENQPRSVDPNFDDKI